MASNARSPSAGTGAASPPPQPSGDEKSSDGERSALFHFLRRRRHAINRWIARSSTIPNDPVLDPAGFDWTAEIAAHWQEIRREAQAIYGHIDAIPPLREISPDHRGIIEDDSWRSFFLIGYGNRIEENIARAPRTTELVSRTPGLNSAFFSILAPGAHIARHRGVTKAFMTAHLGVVVPDRWQDCTMQVEKRNLNWREGAWLVFDDTYEHEVWNETDQPRIVLLCQFARPLRFPGSLLAWALMRYVRSSPFVREAKDNLVDWETAFSKAERGE